MRSITKNSHETEKLGKQYALQFKGGDVVCLYGNLGAGKTIFVKGLAQGFGIKSRIVSPTFVIMREHNVLKHKSIKRFYHLDLYRLAEARDVIGLDLLELMKDQEALIVIEWPEIAQNILPKKRWDVIFTHNETSRTIEITKIL